MNSSNPSQIQPNPTGESELSSEASGVAGTKQRLKESARETVDQVKQAAGATASRVKEEAGRLASEKKRTAAEKLGGYSNAIHDSAKSLEEKDPNIAWFTHRAADRLQGVADYVRERDFGALRRDAEDVARRHPLAFFGGLFVAGLVVGNLLKASSAGATGTRELTEGSDRLGENEGGLRSPEISSRLPNGGGIENQVTT